MKALSMCSVVGAGDADIHQTPLGYISSDENVHKSNEGSCLFQKCTVSWVKN